MFEKPIAYRAHDTVDTRSEILPPGEADRPASEGRITEIGMRMSYEIVTSSSCELARTWLIAPT